MQCRGHHVTPSLHSREGLEQLQAAATGSSTAGISCLLVRRAHGCVALLAAGYRGSTAVTLLGIYYIAPLTSLYKVLKERDSSSIYWPLSLMNLANALLWMVYGMVSTAGASNRSWAAAVMRAPDSLQHDQMPGWVVCELPQCLWSNTQHLFGACQQLTCVMVLLLSTI